MLIAMAAFDVLWVLYAHNTHQTVDFDKGGLPWFTLLIKACTELDCVWLIHSNHSIKYHIARNFRGQ